ncbi:hypothetical protein HMPREF9944_00490, partial [Segatella maculosa OT 289]
GTHPKRHAPRFLYYFSVYLNPIKERYFISPPNNIRLGKRMQK